MTDLARWELNDCSWHQNDQTRSFDLVAYRSQALETVSPAQRRTINLAVPMRAHTAPSAQVDCYCDHFPEEFKYCPFCGGELVNTSVTTDAWVHPYGPGDGSRITRAATFPVPPGTRPNDSALIGDITEMVLPRQSANFAFVVAKLDTAERALACIDRSSGVIDIYLPKSGEWVSLSRKGPGIDCSRQPDWSWSAGLSENGTHGALFWPTPEGPVWSVIDMALATSTLTTYQGRCVGGAVQTNGYCLIPGESGGNLVLFRFDRDTTRWETLTPTTTVVAPNGYLGIPIVDANREKIYWVGESGYLTCSTRSPDLPLTWRAWDNRGTSCIGLPAYGPPHIDRQNRFWQLCVFTDREPTFRYYELGGSHDDFQGNISGEMFSTGRMTCDLERNYWNDPWDTPIGDRQELIRVPLIQFGDNNDTATMVAIVIDAGSLLISEIYDRTLGFVNREAKGIEFHLLSRENLPRRFDMGNQVVSTKRPWECKAFVFQRYFHIYIPDKSKCYRWPIAA